MNAARSAAFIYLGFISYSKTFIAIGSIPQSDRFERLRLLAHKKIQENLINVYILFIKSLRNVTKCKQINFKLLHLLPKINHINGCLVLNSE